MMNMKQKIRVAILAIGGLAAGCTCHAETLYSYDQAALFDGGYGPVAKAQAQAKVALSACGLGNKLTVDGTFGPGTRNALAALAKCPTFAAELSDDADALKGKLTEKYWQLLVGGDAPTLEDRARTIMLTYEATDYTRMEWNFCQSRPLYDPANGRKKCISNDPRSYLTWGPNGATAGGGREVQLILQGVDVVTPGVIDQSFGSEAQAVRRMFVLRDRDSARSLETYLCGIWADETRRIQWKNGFAAAGQILSVRTSFDEFYKSSSLDGGKIATFYKAYSDNGLVPTEVDYAFFKDRSAHTSPSLSPIKQAVAALLTAEPHAARWRVRQVIALRVRPGSQRVDRLGRDVAFYIDGSKGNLSSEELSAWRARGKVHASQAGLSDSRSAAAFTANPAINTKIANPSTLTDRERAACPQAILDTKRP